MTCKDAAKEYLHSYGDAIPEEVKLQKTPSIISTFSCKSIRIGSYKCNLDSYKGNAIRFDSNGMMVKIPPIDADYLVKVKISRKSVKKLSVHFSATSPLLFVHLTQQGCDNIRRHVESLIKETDVEKIKPYFEVNSNDESIKYITVCPKEIQSEAKDLFLLHYFDIFDELDKKMAYNLLLKTSPKTFLFTTKFPPDFGSSSLLTNTTKYCQYPPNGSNCISITSQDYCCLEEKAFLNDTIIDFYLKWLQNFKMKTLDRERTHIFSTFFYKRLTMIQRKIQNKTCNKQLNTPKKRHERVKRWTKSVNIFEKDFVIIPINQHSHWFVAVICFPGCEPRCYNSVTERQVQEHMTKKTVENKHSIGVGEGDNSAIGANLLDDRMSDYDEASVASGDEIFYSPLHGCSLDTQEVSETVNYPNSTFNEVDVGQNNTMKTKCENTDLHVISTSRDTCSYSPSSPSEIDENDTCDPINEDEDVHEQFGLAESEPSSSPKYSSSDCEDMHETSRLNTPTTNQNKDVKLPCIIIFDSLQTRSRARVVGTIREYLELEFQSKMEGKIRKFNVQTLPTNCPMVPQQDNSSDCGVYLLQYIESFFSNRFKNFSINNMDIIEGSERWLLPVSVKHKRAFIAKLIRQLTVQQNLTKEYAFPKLIFNEYKVDFLDIDSVLPIPAPELGPRGSAGDNILKYQSRI